MVVGVDIPGFFGAVRGRHLHTVLTEYGAEGLIFGGFQHDLHHITGGGVLIGIVQTVDIGENGVGATHLLCPLIHHLHEAFLAAADDGGDIQGRIVGGIQHGPVDQDTKGGLLTFLQVAHDGLGRQALVPLGGEGNLLIHVAVLNGQQTGHDFGKGAGVKMHIRVVGIDHRFRVDLIDKGGLGRLQDLVGTAQRGHAVDGAAAVGDGGTAVGHLRRLFIGHRFLRLLRHHRFGGFRGKNPQRQGGKQHDECKQQAENSVFFHIYPSILVLRTCPLKKSRV